MNEDSQAQENEDLNDLVDVEEAERKRLANKPMIDHLPDAVRKDELGRYVMDARPGDKIVMERWATILAGKPWLDTKTYTIVSIDEASGDLKLWDDDLCRAALTNYVSGMKAGYRFKLPNKRNMEIGKKRRGRPRKNPVAAGEPKAAPVDGVKRRGRPAGTKNRPRDVIAAEKKAKLEVAKSKRRGPAKGTA